MADYPAPDEILPIYNGANFSYANIGLTISDADLRYVRLTGSVMTGLLTANAGIYTTFLYGSLGSAASPTYTFNGDTNTGIYSPSADNVSVSTGGTLRWSVSTSGINSNLPYRGIDGSVSAPAYSFSGENNSGLYRIGANDLALSLGGVKKIEFTNSYTDLVAPLRYTTGASAGYVLTSDASGLASWASVPTFNGKFADGTISSPSISFTNETNTGFYRSGASPGALLVSANGINCANFQQTGIGSLSLGISGTAQATSAITGSIQTAGGIAVSKSLWIGGNYLNNFSYFNLQVSQSTITNNLTTPINYTIVSQSSYASTDMTLVNASGFITINTSGLYRVEYSVSWGSSAILGTRRGYISVNNSDVDGGRYGYSSFGSDANNCANTGSATISLNAGDTVRIKILQNSATLSGYVVWLIQRVN